MARRPPWRLRDRLLGLAALLLLGLAPTAAAAAEFGPEDRAAIQRVQDYLNSIETLKAEFLQSGPEGQLARGTLYLRRPGRLRFEYAPPSPLLLVADGFWVVMHDRELDQVSRWPLSDTPLSILVAENVDLSRDARVTRVERKPELLALTLIDAERPEEGSVTVAFSTQPLELRQWRVIDAQGQAVDVILREPQVNIPLDPGLFIVEEKADPTRELGK